MNVTDLETRVVGFQPPAIGDEEIAAVVDTLRSGWLTTGPSSAELERRFAEYVGAKHALALSSCTAALHLSLVALGVGPGDEVVTAPITWPATANVIVHVGATPVFADVRETDLNLDPDAAADAVTPRTKAIIPVHFAGQPCDLDPLLALGLPVVEDAAHAVESVYRTRKVGAISDTTCFSFYATKNVAAGEGGMVTTDRDDLAGAVRDLRLMRRGDGALYDLLVPAYKANLPDVLSAIALVQLGKVTSNRALRLAHVALYDEIVSTLEGITPLVRDSRDEHAYHLYVVRVDADRAGGTRDDYQRLLRERGISTSVHFLAVHTLRWYREHLPQTQPLSVSERASQEVLSLPLSAAHSPDDIRYVAAALAETHARLTS
jgi:dTDP-4-amino-4,6-dideoxygalactose transaminase